MVRDHTIDREFLPSAVRRYTNEIRRVAVVLDRVLEEHYYLMNAKYSHADIVFVCWFEIMPWVVGKEFDLEKSFPNVHAWLGNLKTRPDVITSLGARSEAPKML